MAVDVDIPDQRYPASVESTAYFIAAEAPTNLAKHAHAHTARIVATATTDRLTLVIEDDGVGGATPTAGTGLSGLQVRGAAVGGTLTVESPTGAGTRVRADIPIPVQPAVHLVASASDEQHLPRVGRAECRFARDKRHLGRACRVA